MRTLSFCKMFSFDDGLPDPSDAIPRRGCDPSLFDHYTTLKNAIGIMSKGWKVGNKGTDTISCFARRSDPLFGMDIFRLIELFGHKVTDEGEDGQFGCTFKEDKHNNLEFIPDKLKASLSDKDIILARPGVYWHLRKKYFRKGVSDHVPPPMIALTDCDKLFYRVVALPEKRVVWKLRPDIVRVVFRQGDRSKVDKSLHYPDHLDFVEKRFLADNNIEFLGIEFPYGEKFKYSKESLQTLRNNTHWLSPTRETVERVFGAEAAKKHKYAKGKDM